MSTYLVDFENVGVGGMDGVEKLSDRDRVVIFYGKQAAAVPFERHIEIASSRAEVRYIKVDKTGKNFLDFQLSSYCGYLIGSTSENEFIIVSRDNGFGSMEDFWHGKEMSGKKISMKRRPAIAVSGEKLESVREIIVDKGERQAAASEETVQEKEKESFDSAEKEGKKRKRRKRRNPGKPQTEGALKLQIQTIPAENKKQAAEQGREPEKTKACETGEREQKPLEKSLKPESEKQKLETAAEKNRVSQKQEGTQERYPYKSRRRPRGRYVWKRQPGK